MPKPNPTRILVSCGEASGDLYLAGLLRALGERLPELEAFGLAGDRSRAAGADLVVHLDEISVIGLVEVLRKLPALSGAMDRLVAAARRLEPAACVLVDFSGFNLRLARRLRRLGIPVLYYVSPQVWAWRRGRLATIREVVDEMIVILPFEQAFYEKEGIAVRYVGHPLVDLVSEAGRLDRAAFCRDHGLDPDPGRPILFFLPGSRRREIELHLPVLRRVIVDLGRTRPELQFLVSRAPTVPPGLLVDGLGAAIDRVRILGESTYEGLAHAAVAVVASGTATIETALAGTPMVVVYKVGRMSYALGRSFVKVPHYSMVNLVAEREVVPELIQDGMTAGAIVEHVVTLLDDGEARDAMKHGLEEVRAKLGGGGASARAAEAVASFLEKTRALS